MSGAWVVLPGSACKCAASRNASDRSPKRPVMIEFTLLFFAVAVPAVLFAGISKGGFGSAAAFAAAPILTLVVAPEQAVAIMLPLLIVMDFTALRAYWRKWDAEVSKILIIGTVPGALIGAALVSITNPNVFQLLIGLIALGFVAYQLSLHLGWLRPAKRPMSNAAGYGFGIGAGFTSFIAHAGGPVTAIYMLSRRLGKLEYQATTVVIFWLNNLLKLGVYIWLGFLSPQTLLAGLYLFPVAVFGTFVGVRLNAFVPEKVYFALIYIFLVGAGTKLVLDALF